MVAFDKQKLYFQIVKNDYFVKLIANNQFFFRKMVGFIKKATEFIYLIKKKTNIIASVSKTNAKN